jgi:hypothetical protein
VIFYRIFYRTSRQRARGCDMERHDSRGLGGADLAAGATRFTSASGSDTVVGSSTTSLISGCEHNDDVPVAGWAVDLVDSAVHLFETQ